MTAIAIAELILSDAPLDTPVKGVDTDEIDAPEDFTSESFTFDPYVGS
jgi:hypothetical protein